MSHPPAPITVLHVDDEPEVADLTATFLEREDARFEVETATDADAALDRLAGAGVDCVVSDYEMPGRNGIEFLEAVRREHPDLPFILFTGRGSEEVASEAISAGVTDYLQKQSGTTQYELLANRIRRAVDSHRSEQYARQQDRQYRELFDQAPIMYVLVRDERGWPIIEDCNDRFLETLGYERAAVVGRPATDFFTEESTAEVYEGGGYERALAGEFDLEERTLVTKDGDRIDTVLRATPRLDAGGDVIGAQTLYLDVTQRMARERELELYETMIETIPDGVYALDDDLRYLAVNQGMVDLTGYSKEELVGSHVSLVNDEEAVALTERQREELVAGGIDDGIMTAENTYVTADGEEIPTEGRFRALPPADDGSFRGTAGVIRDVSDRERRERELERYETIIEASGDPVYTVDADGRLTFVNDAFCALVDYPEADLVGAHVSVVMDEADIERGEGVIRTLLETGTKRETFEMDLIRADGERIPCEAHIALLPFDEEFRGTTGIHRVITDRKRRENALRALHEATGALMRARDEEAVADRAVETARTVLDLPICGLWLYDEAADVLRPAAVADESRDLLGEAPTYTGEGSLSWQAFEDGEIRIYDDLHEEPGRLNPETPIRSELILPLGAHGVMNFGATEKGSFDELDVSLARVLANTVETALTRTERDRTLKRIQRRTETLMTTETVEETARVAVETARDVLGAESSGFHRRSGDGRRLEPLVIAGGSEEILGERPTYDRDAESDPVSAFVWDVYERGEPAVIEDAGAHERLAGETATGSGFVHPVEGVGVFIVSSTEPHAFDEIDATLVEILASALTTALDRVERESLLRERQHTLERQNERLEEFASVVSHDLRNPLNVARGRIDLAREACDDEHLASAAGAVDRSLALIDDLLALAREGRSVDDVEPVALATLVDDSWEHVETGDVTLVVDTERTIRADRNRLAQLLENLFRNSVEHGSTGSRPQAGDSVEHGSTGSAAPHDAAEHGSPDVTVTVGDLADGTGFYVADDGPGIPPDERERVFESGYSTSERGTGFGLSIVREIAEAHGWEISVTDGETGGARFEITGVETVPGRE